MKRLILILFCAFGLSIGGVLPGAAWAGREQYDSPSNPGSAPGDDDEPTVTMPTSAIGSLANEPTAQAPRHVVRDRENQTTLRFAVTALSAKATLVYEGFATTLGHWVYLLAARR